MSRNQKKIFSIDDKTIFTGPKDPKKLQPMCVGENSREYGFNSQGYIMPCCWTVQEKGYEEDQFKDLMKDKFHISNINKIEDVVNSDEWKNFADTLINKPQNAPNICWFFCDNKNSKKQKHKY
tara:strand:+ start:70 stop:438 length:369 start_codon:yes stop_codon:yes gene_type:complete